ncbi:biotin transport system substrate-specific component [Aminobacter aminovorans]|jgi:biotin transport system substrate-specific component|uniref:Biotin transporter n=1 Tax=Aminobacter aminovorans TaxID=83263 RepID=A0A380WFN9_AMIAI|nr:biotin transporter BioY [Aminobacter aminovorans]TCS21698.1 biotin transport system substrate-specific component [Aminobacter aminovorans]SUU87558.1 Biotin ECF transporter S component BioY [Aminobacter aminovorans]
MTLYQAVADGRTSRLSTLDIAAIVAGSLLLTASAKIQMPFYPVPMTVQTLVVIGLGLALGPIRGAAAVALYLTQGALGLPVFAGTPEKGIGLAYMMGPTGGYLAGYLPAALLAGWLAERGWDRNVVTAMLAALLAGAVIYLPGLLWLGSVVGWDKPVLALGLYPFIPSDIMKAVLAALAFPAAWKWLSHKGMN